MATYYKERSVLCKWRPCSFRCNFVFEVCDAIHVCMVAKCMEENEDKMPGDDIKLHNIELVRPRNCSFSQVGLMSLLLLLFVWVITAMKASCTMMKIY